MTPTDGGAWLALGFGLVLVLSLVALALEYWVGARQVTSTQ
jgi:hypothetical protein